MQQTTPLIFIVDDDPSVRGSVSLLIGAAGWQCEAFDSARGFLSRARPDVPCCLVLDVNLPDLSGLELQRCLSAEGPAMPIIFISGYGTVPITVEAMKAGAVEFLMKPIVAEVLLNAIHQAVERSQAALEKSLQDRMLRLRHESLSRREREVMALVVEGLMNKHVADELGISEITVKAHRGAMMRKMQARSVAELVKIAARLGQAVRDGLNLQSAHA